MPPVPNLLAPPPDVDGFVLTFVCAPEPQAARIAARLGTAIPVAAARLRNSRRLSPFCDCFGWIGGIELSSRVRRCVFLHLSPVCSLGLRARDSTPGRGRLPG